MKSPLRQRLVQLAGAALAGLVLLVLAGGALGVRSVREAEDVRAGLAARSGVPAPRPEAARAEVARLARAAKPAPPADAPPVGPLPANLMHPAHDARFGRNPAERPIHDWLRAVRLARVQPGPPPPPDVVAVLAEVADELDALAAGLSRADAGGIASFVVPGDTELRRELERARALLLAAACAESLSPTGDPARGERLLEAAWTLARGMPVGMDDAGPGDLFLAVVRQVRVADARAWDARLVEMDPQSRLADALEWDAAQRLASWERTAEKRRQLRPGWVPPFVQRVLGEMGSRHDLVFTSRIAAVEVALADEVRSLDRCDDPWVLARSSTGALKRNWAGAGPPGEGRLRLALASASLQQADAALTRHVLLRRHGLEPPRDACGADPLVERSQGNGRFVVGWRIPGRDEPGVGDRERPRNLAAGFRTWPEPSLPGPSLDLFRFEAAEPRVPVLASAPAP